MALYRNNTRALTFENFGQGTPLQNNLDEYWEMVNFVKEGLMWKKKHFRENWGEPIKQSMLIDAEDWQVRRYCLNYNISGILFYITLFIVKLCSIISGVIYSMLFIVNDIVFSAMLIDDEDWQVRRYCLQAYLMYLLYH